MQRSEQNTNIPKSKLHFYTFKVIKKANQTKKWIKSGRILTDALSALKVFKFVFTLKALINASTTISLTSL